MKKTNVRELLKFYHAVEGNRKVRDLVDGVLIKLTELSRKDSKIKYSLSAAIGYEKELKSYWLVTRAGLSQKKRSQGIMRFSDFTRDMIPKNISGMPTLIEHLALEGKSRAIYEIDTSMSPDEQKNPANLAPMLADLVLSYRKGINVKDYKILSAQWKDLPDDPQIPRDKIKGYRMLEINLEAKLTE